MQHNQTHFQKAFSLLVIFLKSLAFFCVQTQRVYWQDLSSWHRP